LIPNDFSHQQKSLFVQIPLLLRLMTEIDQVATNSRYDRLSYDGFHISRTRKNYYFWSASFTARELMEKGHAPEDVRVASEAFAREYKRLRRLEHHWGSFTSGVKYAGGDYTLHYGSWPKAAFLSDFREVARAAGRGASFGAKIRGATRIDDCTGVFAPEPLEPTLNGAPIPLTDR
jgi:hypothetical protein